MASPLPDAAVPGGVRRGDLLDQRLPEQVRERHSHRHRRRLLRHRGGQDSRGRPTSEVLQQEIDGLNLVAIMITN